MDERRHLGPPREAQKQAHSICLVESWLGISRLQQNVACPPSERATLACQTQQNGEIRPEGTRGGIRCQNRRTLLHVPSLLSFQSSKPHESAGHLSQPPQHLSCSRHGPSPSAWHVRQARRHQSLGQLSPLLAVVCVLLLSV